MLKSVPCLWLHAGLTLSASLRACFLHATERICFARCWEPSSALLPPNVARRTDSPQPCHQHAALLGPGTAGLFGGSLCSLCGRSGKEGAHRVLLLPLLLPLPVKRKSCWTRLSCELCRCEVPPQHRVVSSPPLPLGAGGRAVFVAVSPSPVTRGEVSGGFHSPLTAADQSGALLVERSWL